MTQSTKFPTAYDQLTGPVYANPSNLGAADTNYTTVTCAAAQSATLRLKGFTGFAIPDGAVVTSVVLTVRAMYSTSINAGAITARAEKNLVVTGRAYASTNNPLNGVFQTLTLDLTNLASWDSTYFSDNVLSIQLISTGGSDGGSFTYDYATVTVTYNPAGSGTSTFRTRSFGVLASVPRHTPPRVQVEIRDEGLPNHFELQAVVDRISQITYTRRLNAAGEFTLAVPQTAADIGAITSRRAVVRVVREGREEFAGLVMNRKAKFAKEGRGVWLWTLTGQDMSAIFRRRSILVPAGQTVATYTGLPGPVIQSVLADNYMGTNSGRRGGITSVADARMGFVTQAGVTQTYTASNQTLVDFITSITQAGNIGYRTRLDLTKGQTVVDCYAGVNRTFPNGPGGGVLFSFTAENLIDCEYEDDGLSLVNRLYVGGSGSGSDRTIVTVNDTPSQADWGLQEGFLDYRIGGANSSALTTAGNLFLKALTATERISATFQETDGCRYRIHWDVGDTVTVEIPDLDLLIDLQITAVTVTINQGDAYPELTVQFGLPPMNPFKMLGRMRQEYWSALQNLS